MTEDQQQSFPRKSLNNSSNHKSRMDKHTGARYKCDNCPKTFTTLQDRDRHTSVHTGNYRFSCQVCGKGFNRNDHLNKHYKTHR